MKTGDSPTAGIHPPTSGQPPRALPVTRSNGPSMRRRVGRLQQSLLIAMLTGAATLVSCAATETTRYYTLAGSVAVVDAAPTMQIAVAPVLVPEGLARPQLVVRRAGQTVPGRIDILEQSRWTSGFDEELRRAFAEAIATRLKAADVSLGGELGDLPVWRVGIQLRGYDAIPGDRVAMTFGWVFGRSDRTIQFACQRSRVVSLTSRDPDEVVRGIRSAVATVATEIAAQVQRAAAVNPGGEGRGVCVDPAEG